MNLGISSYSFPWAVGVPGFAQPRQRMSASDLVEEAHELGAAVLQFGDNLPLHELAETDLDRLAEVAHQNGIAIEVGTRGVSRDALWDYLRLAERLKARLVRTLLPRQTNGAGLAEVIGELAAVLSDYEAAGVVLALENYEAYSADEFAEILRRLPSPSLAICLDTANNLGRGESLGDLIAAFGSRIACLHVKDIRITRIGTRMGFRVEGCPAGEGVIDLPVVLKALGAAGVPLESLSVILEQWPPEQDDIDSTLALERRWARSSFKHLERVALGRLAAAAVPGAGDRATP